MKLNTMAAAAFLVVGSGACSAAQLFLNANYTGTVINAPVGYQNGVMTSNLNDYVSSAHVGAGECLVLYKD